ncbi:hypothetical protein Hanom_Chr11g00988651 [Helianthus anomalus]
MGKHGLHGEAEWAAHYSNINEVRGDHMDKEARLTNSIFSNIRPHIASSNDGPTPVNPLGKRPRDVQSPHSIGSVQDPSQRIFSQNQGSVHESLDFNTPSGVNNVFAPTK